MKTPVTKEHLQIVHHHLRHRWRTSILWGLAVISVALIGVQMLYPWSNLPLYATVGNQPVGGMSADAATTKLNDIYKNLPIPLYFGNSPKPYRQPKPADIGLSVDSRPQVDGRAYTFWLRLVPTSLWWAHAVTPRPGPSYTRDPKIAGEYVQKELGQSCNVSAENATLAYKDSKLQVVPAIDGGTCKLADVEQQLNTAMPRLVSHAIHIPMVQHPAAIHDQAAAQVAADLTAKASNLSVKAGTSSVAIPQATFLSWLDFAAPDSGIVATVNADRASDFFTKQVAPKVTVKAGTSQITTLDFTEINRVDGTPGQALDSTALVKLLNQLLGGANPDLVAPVAPVAPTPVYTRTYSKSDTGLSALLTQFAQSHPGTFGVSYAELDGQQRHAGYNDTRVFETASTYKLFVAYSTLKRIDAGTWHWTDQIEGGKNLTQCFSDMIKLSDNACAEALLNKIGYATITSEIHALGLNSSSFMTSYIQSTTADEATFLGALQSGQLLSPTSTSTMLAAMRGNVYRQGIPAGASGAVADKVGFLNALLHDAAVVYSPSGTYVLVVMTDGSSWNTIADLTRAIESWRSS